MYGAIIEWYIRGEWYILDWYPLLIHSNDTPSFSIFATLVATLLLRSTLSECPCWTFLCIERLAGSLGSPHHIPKCLWIKLRIEHARKSHFKLYCLALRPRLKTTTDYFGIGASNNTIRWCWTAPISSFGRCSLVVILCAEWIPRECGNLTGARLESWIHK